MKKFFAALLAISITAVLSGCDKSADEQIIDDITEGTFVVTEAAETVSETETEASAETASETAETAVETSATAETSSETEKTTTAVSSETVSDTKIKTDGIDITGAWIDSEYIEGDYKELYIFDGKNVFVVGDDDIDFYSYKLNGTTITVDFTDMTVDLPVIIENEKVFISDQDGYIFLEPYAISDLPCFAKQQDIMGVWADTGVYGNLWFIDENSIIEFSGVTTHSNSYKFDGDKMTSDNGDMSAVLFDNKLYLTDKYGTDIFERIQPTKPSIADFEGSGYIYKNGENLGYITFKDGKEIIESQTPDDYSPAEISISGNKVKFSLFGKTGEYTCYIKSFKQEYADKHIFLLNDSDYIVFEKLS